MISGVDKSRPVVLEPVLWFHLRYARGLGSKPTVSAALGSRVYRPNGSGDIPIEQELDAHCPSLSESEGSYGEPILWQLISPTASGQDEATSAAMSHVDSSTRRATPEG